MDNEETQTVKLEHLGNAKSLRKNIDELDPSQISSREELMAIFAANGDNLKKIIIGAGKKTETGTHTLSLNNTEAVYNPENGNSTITVDDSSDPEGDNLRFEIAIPNQARNINKLSLHLTERDEEGRFIPDSGTRLDKDITPEQASRYAERYKQAITKILDGLEDR